MTWKIAVIGAGPAGMMAAVSAADEGADVTIYEKNEKLGKKLYITGKGRCNLTNACDSAEFFEHVARNGKFLYSAFYSFTNEDAMAFFRNAGLELKEERGKRVFPASDHSSDVIRTMEKEVRRRGIHVRLNSEIKDLSELDADAVIVATGGLSYPGTGSTGDGYVFAGRAGHTVTETLPALVPLTVSESWIKDLEGLSLRNIEAAVLDPKGRKVCSEFGEMLFTSRGVSGPVILTISSRIARDLTQKEYLLSIDFKPALTPEQLDARILRDFSEEKNRDFKNSLGKLLPAKLIPVVVQRSGIMPEKKVNEITRQERQELVSLLKHFPMHINGTEGFRQAVITTGGISVKEIDPRTMESKICPGLYFAGEVIDVDAYTGGFNIQIALSTGYLAGRSAAQAARNNS